MSNANTTTNSSAVAWDRLFAEAESRQPNIVKDWFGREAVYRAHDRLHVLFGHLDPQAVDETVLMKGMLDDGMTGQAVIDLRAAWMTLSDLPTHPAVKLAAEPENF